MISTLWPFRKKKEIKKLSHNYGSVVEKTYTPVSQLVLGMYVVELDRPWLDTPFLFQGFEIRTQSQLQAVKSLCAYVFIDTTRTRKIVFTRGITSNSENTSLSKAINIENSVPPKKLGSFEKEIVKAEQAYTDTNTLLTDVMKQAAQGKNIDGWLAKKAVSDCVNTVLQSPDAMLWLIRLKEKDEHTVTHSLNVCVLAIVLGRHLNLPEAAMVNLGLCGLLHDVGKMQIPYRLITRQGKLEGEELKIMQSHTKLGYELLKSSDNIESCVLETALTHHERLDGTGYPRQLRQASISDFTKIISIVNTYDSLINNRANQNYKTHLEATHLMTKLVGTKLDRSLLIKFIESLGVYPPGCVVMMTNGAIAIVVEVNDRMKLRPKVILLRDEENNPMPEQLIDLAQMATDKNGNVYTIKNVVNPDDLKINPKQYHNTNFLESKFALRKHSGR
ncbi:MAG: HD-GYP domain-containing protein [Methylobacter sp.]|uniref:HD-GYP domain-containing protein n=1 Tax=Methylovulum miyakonense TaxID=645578 RepID=UPI00039FCBA1|nr:HD-GYP domain-containing protein [Methylovulum miyakonense]PPD40942.1 MAG: HD-GYP domain-containing protein [Methylobacter sp.]